MLYGVWSFCIFALKIFNPNRSLDPEQISLGC